MIDPRNVVSLTAGIVVDPELVNDKIAKLRVAVDYAGSEKGASGSSGYFDIVYYLKDGEQFVSKNGNFVYNQITSKKMKKGSQIQLVGRLVQERWKQDDSNRSRVVVVAESISYLGSAPKSNGSDAKSESGDSSSVVPQEF
jgi:hypothetical protein